MKETHVVKILTSNDGEDRESPVWCYVVFEAGVLRTLCEGEALGAGDSACKYESKPLIKGGITCTACIRKIRAFKSIKL